MPGLVPGIHVFAAQLHKSRGWPGREPGHDDDIFRNWLMSSSLLFLLVHRKHALSDQEAAEDIHGRKNERDETERTRP